MQNVLSEQEVDLSCSQDRAPLGNEDNRVICFGHIFMAPIRILISDLWLCWFQGFTGTIDSGSLGFRLEPKCLPKLLRSIIDKGP